MINENTIEWAVLDFQDLKKWLQSYDPQAIVGQAGNPQYCPIKNYLSSKYEDILSVGVSSATRTSHKPISFKNFTPMSELIYALDNTTKGSSIDITAETALQCLKIIEEKYCYAPV